VRTVAALYVDPRGPYPAMPGVECWDEQRDARGYDGPHAVVAHPPCGPWGRLYKFCRHQPAELGPIAVAQTRRWGGVLEHPRDSRLWRHCGMPLPGELPDGCGGWTLAVNQVDFGHPCLKPTWLYVVGVRPSDVRVVRQRREPTHTIGMTRAWRPGTNRVSPRANLPECSALVRRLTPHDFAAFLVDIARRTSASASNQGAA
jgi:hypothetical protein